MTSNKAHKDDSKGDFDSTSALIRPSWLGEFHLWNMMISIWHDRFRTEFNLEGAGELRALPKALSPVYDKKYKYAYQRFSWEGTVLLFLLDMQFEIAKHLFSSSRNRAKVIDWLIAQLSFLLLISVSLAKLNPTEMYSFLFSLTTRS